MANGNENNIGCLGSYNAAMELLIHEFRTLGERTNAFLITQSIFVGAFVLLVTQTKLQHHMSMVIALAISIIALLFCILHYFSGKTGAEQAFKWRFYMHNEIEKKAKDILECPVFPWQYLYNKCD